jgi:hypothetical protein
MFLRVEKRCLKDTYLFLIFFHRLGWFFCISCFLVQFSLSFYCNGLEFIVDRLCFICCLLIVSFIFDAVIFLREKINRQVVISKEKKGGHMGRIIKIESYIYSPLIM